MKRRRDVFDMWAKIPGRPDQWHLARSRVKGRVVIYAVAVLVVVLTLAVLAVPYRASFLRERPFTHRGVEYPHATALAHQLGEAATLAPAQAPPGLDWIADFFLAPVWLFWGDLRSRRPVNRLRRWRLDGTRPSGRAAFVHLVGQLDALEAFGLALTA
jgi:hypothetical protein